MDRNAAVSEALDILSPDDVASLLNARYGACLLERFAAGVKGCLEAAPELSRQHGLVPTARRVLTADPQTRMTLTRDPALGRFTASLEQALEASEVDRLPGLLLLLPRPHQLLLPLGDLLEAVVPRVRSHLAAGAALL